MGLAAGLKALQDRPRLQGGEGPRSKVFPMEFWTEGALRGRCPPEFRRDSSTYDVRGPFVTLEDSEVAKCFVLLYGRSHLQGSGSLWAARPGELG